MCLVQVYVQHCHIEGADNAHFLSINRQLDQLVQTNMNLNTHYRDLAPLSFAHPGKYMDGSEQRLIQH